MVIYQILPRLFGNPSSVNKRGGTLAENGTGKFSSIDHDVLEYINWLGASHVYLTGIMNHSCQEDFADQKASHPSIVKGRAGSPFAVRNHYDVAAYLADDPSQRMEEFDEMVARIHAAGLKLIIDFIPNHVARDYVTTPYTGPAGMQLGVNDDCSVHWSEDNDFYYYPSQYLDIPQAEGVQPYVEYPAKASGNVFGPVAGINDWWETIKINYCDYYTPTWEKMYSVLEFWAAKGIDAFRCDMVELVPSEFFKWAINRLKQDYPEVQFIAETYSKDQYTKFIREVGFDFLYDKSGLYDSLKKIVRVANEEDRQSWQSTSLISANWQYLGDNQPFMLNFLENHDEVRFASDFYAGDGQWDAGAGSEESRALGKVAAPLAVSLFLNRASFMLYTGCELGETGMDSEGFSGLDGKTTIFDWWNPSSAQELWKIIHKKEYLQKDKYPLLNLYKSALCKKNSALIEKGLTYDLLYCNHFPGSIYAFIRSHEGNNELFVCNFASYEQKTDVLIPQHAFNYLPLSQSETLHVGKPLQVVVPPYSFISIDL